MALSKQAQEIYTQISAPNTKLGDLRKIAKTIKRDHDLALELWSTGGFYARQLAILIMDKKQLSQAFIDQLGQDIRQHELEERNQLTDWLMANQLTKDKKTIALMKSWEQSPSPIQRRIFWYYQARLRWMGQTPPDNNNADLLKSISTNMAAEVPEVQWAMNFAAGQIGIHEPALRTECIEIGERIGLYKDDPVPKNCTPDYLPEFIRTEVEKLQRK